MNKLGLGSEKLSSRSLHLLNEQSLNIFTSSFINKLNMPKLNLVQIRLVNKAHKSSTWLSRRVYIYIIANI
jgi:hypothetical protein